MPSLPTTNTLDTEFDSGWLTIWFDQVDKRNALTDELRADLHAVLAAVGPDQDVRGITLRGRGGIFCAGGDLKHFKSDFQATATVEDIKAMSRDAAAIFDRVDKAPQVVVALIEGAALAGGFGLACCADVVICADDARFAMTEAMIGLSPAQIAPFVIRKVGPATGRRLMLTAARFDGREAAALGVADYSGATVRELENIEATIRRQVLRCAPGAVAETKNLLREMQGASRDDVIELAAENFAARMKSDEAVEGIAAFFAKETPSWTIELGETT
ncbi:MAG: enoyl-CoA hydratase/isomerase family protein [Acidimicrobiales bacterium]